MEVTHPAGAPAAFLKKGGAKGFCARAACSGVGQKTEQEGGFYIALLFDQTDFVLSAGA